MTDLDRLKDTFSKVGIPFTQCNDVFHITKTGKLLQGTPACRLVLDSGVGYAGFACDFYFDAAGRCLGHGVWE